VKESAIRSWALGAAAVATLAACATSLQASHPNLPADSAQVTTHGADQRSRMLPEAKSEDLLYVSDLSTKQAVYVFSYPGGKRVGTLTGLYFPAGECVDPDGNIWIVTIGKIVEYAHGSTTPIATLNGFGFACAINPRNGDLALSGGDDPGQVTIYKNARGTPTIYSDPAIPVFYYCAYDGDGNLFITTNLTEHPLVELPKNASAIVPISYPKTVYLGSDFWDGSQLVVEEVASYRGPGIFDQVSVRGLTATIVGSIEVYGRHNKNKNQAGTQYALYNGVLIGPNHSPVGDRFVDFWQYPEGGAAFKQILLRNSLNLVAAVVSPKR
jgi:hypothetical protein